MIDPRVPDETLLPCPFCGGEASEFAWRNHVGCKNDNCGAYGANITIEQWNRRAQLAQAEPYSWEITGFGEDGAPILTNDSWDIETARKNNFPMKPLYLAPHCPNCAKLMAEHDRLAQCVDRFLNWPLPKTFSPDCGISFSRTLIGPDKVPGPWPVGTNLFTADEARQMLEHVLAAAPESEEGEGKR